MTKFIPVNEPLLEGNERRYLNECIDSGWISSEGPFVERFETAFANLVGHDFGVAVSNGTDALELAVHVLGLGPGDEVILPTFTIISCASAIIKAGATPVLIDCDPVTMNMKIDDVRQKITAQTRCIMIVHIYGHPVDVDPIQALCQEFGLKLIEDTAEAIGLKYKGRPCGGFGDLSTFSLYANKHVTTGEGGIVTTNSSDLAAKCRYYRNLAFRNPRFVHNHLGWNMRFTNIQAAIGLAQVERLDEFITMKRTMGRRYNQLLGDIKGLQRPVDKTEFSENVYWVYGMVLEDDIPFDAAEMIRRLAECNIGSRPFFWPMHEQPVFQDMELFKGETYPVSERVARRGFYIPCSIGITLDQISRVSEALHKIMGSV